MPRKSKFTPEERRANKRAYNRNYQHNWRNTHLEHKLEQERGYRDKHREKLNARSRAAYHANRNKERERRRLWRINNPEKASAQDRATRLRNLEKARAKDRNYQQTHLEENALKESARRAKKRNASVNDLTIEQWREIKDHYGHRCVYCGRKMQRLTQDHIVPLSKGGTHTFSNIVPACLSCNSRKGNRAPLAPVQPLLLTIAPSKKAKVS